MLLNELNKLNKDQKGLVSILAGGLIVLLAWNIIPGLTTILAVAGFVLMGLGLLMLELHTKVLNMFSKDKGKHHK